MKLNTRELNNIVIISLEIDLMGRQQAEEFHDKVSNLLLEGKKNMIIDLSDAKIVRSAVLGGIMKAFFMVKEAGGHLKLAGVSDKVRNLLVIVKFNNVIEQYNTIEEAVKSF